MRLRLKGINFATKKLAAGERKTYWYAWRGGPLLPGEPGSAEFIAAYNEAIARKVAPPSGVLLSIIQGYQASEDFKLLAQSTRRSYVAHIKRIETEFADFPLAAMTDKRTRGIFLGWRDRIAAGSGRRQADYAWSVLALIVSWALNRGLVAANPCERGGRVYRGSRSDRIWTADDESRFMQPRAKTPPLAALARPFRTREKGPTNMAKSESERAQLAFESSRTCMQGHEITLLHRRRGGHRAALDELFPLV